MKDVEIYGDLIERFIRKMTSPEVGQFKLEISTFKIILDRARREKPSLVKFSIVDSGEVINNLKDTDESIESLSTLLGMSMDFLSSLIGEELANDIVVSNMTEYTNDMADSFKGRERLREGMPEPFRTLITDNQEMMNAGTDHEEIIDLFTDVFQAYLRDLSRHTDLSPVKIKIVLLREKIDLVKSVEMDKDNRIIIDRNQWSTASKKEVGEALSALFNSMVDLSTFLMGKEESTRKASEIFKYYFDGKESVLESYDILDSIMDGDLYKKVSTGLDVLDSRMGGGIPKGASLLLVSPSGIERDIFINDMLKRGLNSGCSAMMVTSKEPPSSIRMMLRSSELDPANLENSGRLRIIDWYSWRGERIIGVERDGHALKSSKILSNLGIAINKGLRELEKSPNRIGIIHMIAPAANLFEFNQIYNFIQRLRAKFKDNDLSSIFLLESDALSRDMESRLLEVFDGHLEIRKTAHGGDLKREIIIKALSGVDFNESPIPFHLKENCIIPEITDDIEPEIDLGTEIKKPGLKKKLKRKIKKKKRKTTREPSSEIKVQDRVKISNDKGKIQPKKVRRIIKKKLSENGPDGSDMEGVDLGLTDEPGKSNVSRIRGTIDALLDGSEKDGKLVVKPRPVRKRIK